MGKTKILLIEDDPVQSEFISRQLKSSGYEVLVASRAIDGIDLAKKEKPALIILDMILPGMHGLEAAVKLLDMPETKNIPIVALSGMTIPKFVEECYRVGIKDFLKKPCDPKHLLKVVEKFAGKQRREGVVAVISRVSAAYTQLVMYLGKMHLKVETLLPSPKNLEKLAAIRPNIIFMEIDQDEKNKKDFIKKIKQNEELREIPLLIFSSKIAEEKMPDLVEELAADGHVVYPFEYFSLMEIINQFLKTNE